MEQSDAIDAGGATLGPVGGESGTEPPASAPEAGGAGVVVGTVDEGGRDVVVRPAAVGCVGELEQAAATSAIAARKGATWRMRLDRRGLTAGRLS